ncbi:MAG: SMI1/KNR4 family protein [Actinomycetes bacterium]
MLERLRRLLPPPAHPVEAGRPDGWAEVEAALGTGLPSDFKAFTELYGSGTIDDFLYLFNPFTQGQDGNLLVERDRVLAGYRQTRARFPERLPWPPFPEPGGVLPLGRTDNGDELYWVTDGDPDRWSVALVEARAALQEVHPVSVTGLLAALAANQLTSRVLPEDLLRRPSHQFTPFPDP